MAEEVKAYLRDQQESSSSDATTELREDELEQYLLSKGSATHIAIRNESDEEFDSFESIKVEGETLSETIIRERR